MELSWKSKQATFMMVTVQIASAWLALHNHINRDVRDHLLAYYHYSAPVQLSSFVTIFCTGLQQQPHDRTVIALREGMFRGQGRNSNAQPEIYGKTARAIQAYMQGAILTKLYQPTEEPFPLPTRSTTTIAGPDPVARNAGQLFARGSQAAGVAHDARKSEHASS